ncbi:hypothetical protein M501DRAFT_931153 [Patellaria atrata CBS 101060]|uniref:Rhodopsin domain-containing protein n=1 Tax=Patellaria atrata CBS 101060 TaxID=1346257 RepID=A0A9P4SCY2_9PEZI|nr:hypothetical protein M501DRAFT_931153 [Patellaria atrata CBS 101060]
MLLPRALYDVSPPRARETQRENNPSLLFSWWCTGMALTIILFRLGGRLVRNNRLFREDKIMALSIIPLLARMAFVHCVLLYGTNNTMTEGMDARTIHYRSIGARLVLPARIFYAAFIWTAKLTVLEFLKRMTQRFWKRGYELALRGIFLFLFLTFLGVVISTLAECQPFHHYWQVVPDPGPQCRLGYAQLVTMGVTDVLTDITIVVFPIPIILQSSMPWRRKADLIMLFSLSIALIVITCARVPNVIWRNGSQQYRTVFASAEIMAAAAVSNAVVLGSFLRDRGVKKAKFKFGSTTDSIERTSTRRTTMTAQQWGSDEDLIRDMGYRLDADLQTQPTPRAPPQITPGRPTPHGDPKDLVNAQWRFPRESEESPRASASADPKASPLPSPHDLRIVPPKRNVSFFDVGGLLEPASASSTNLPSPVSGSSAQDFALASRRGSRALISDLGGLLPPPGRRHSRPQPEAHELVGYQRSRPREGSAPIGIQSPRLERRDPVQTLQDVGGLLEDDDREARSCGARSSVTRVDPLGLPPSPISEIPSPSPTLSVSRPGTPPGTPPGERGDTGPSFQDVGGLLR